MRNGTGGTLVNAILRTLLVIPAAACSSSSPPAHKAASTQVQVAGFAFAPAAVSVSVGDTVKFHNTDMVPHNASAGTAFDSDSLKPGADWAWVADKAGLYDYVCKYHPTMKGTVTVK